MKLSTRCRYGVRLMLALARRYPDAPPLTEIAEIENISLRFLGQIVIPLRQAKLVVSVRGPKGGYRLARDPDAVSLLAVIEAIQGDLNLIECVVDNTCGRAGCAARNAWTRINEKARKAFSEEMLGALVRESAQTSGVLDFSI